MTASVTEDRNTVKPLKSLENWYLYFYSDRPEVQVNERQNKTESHLC